MAVNDPIGDMLTRIRNAQLRRRPKVSTPASNMRARVLDVLSAHQVSVLRTDYHGAITLTSDGRQYQITPWRAAPPLHSTAIAARPEAPARQEQAEQSTAGPLFP